MFPSTTVYSGNSHDGISTTTEGTSSTYFSISGSLLGGDAYNALPGGVAGQIGGNGLVPEIVQAEEVVPSNESVAYAEGVITLVNTYPIPSSMPADLSGSTSNLGLALIYMAVKGAGYSSVFGFIPSTNAMTGHGLSSEEASALDNMALNNGPNDGVSQTSTAPPTSVLVTLAAAGRNPTDITIPTVGGEGGDGGDGGDGSGRGLHPGAEIGDGPDPPPSVGEGTHEVAAGGGGFWSGLASWFSPWAWSEWYNSPSETAAQEPEFAPPASRDWEALLKPMDEIHDRDLAGIIDPKNTLSSELIPNNGAASAMHFRGVIWAN